MQMLLPRARPHQCSQTKRSGGKQSQCGRLGNRRKAFVVHDEDFIVDAGAAQRGGNAETHGGLARIEILLLVLVGAGTKHDGIGTWHDDGVGELTFLAPWESISSSGWAIRGGIGQRQDRVGFVSSIRQYVGDSYRLDAIFCAGLLTFFTVRMSSCAFPPSTKMSGLADALNSIWLSMAAGTESANVQKGARITAPAAIVAARSRDVASLPGSSIFVAPFQKDRSGLSQRILVRVVPKTFSILNTPRFGLSQ
jgi:hypothetical protein